MGLCEQCVHFSTRDSEEYITYCARCRNRNKFVRRTDDSGAGTQSPIESFNQKQGGYQPFVAPKQQPNQNVQGRQNGQQFAGVGVSGAGGAGMGMQNMQNNMQSNLQNNMSSTPNMQMPWQNIIQSNMPNLNQNIASQNTNGQSAGRQSINGQNITPFSFVNNSNTGANNMQTSGSESREELTLRDKFALVVLQNPSLNIAYTSPADIATICYTIADALIEARGNKK